MHAATSKTTYAHPSGTTGGAGAKRPPPAAALLLAAAAQGGAKRRAEDEVEKVEIEYFSKEEQAREAAAKGGLAHLIVQSRDLTHSAAKTPVVLSRTVTGKWVDDVVTPWGAVKEDQRAPFSKIPGQAFNYAKASAGACFLRLSNVSRRPSSLSLLLLPLPQIEDSSLMAAEREKAKKHKTFNEIEKRKVPPPLPIFQIFPPFPPLYASHTFTQRDLGQCSRAKSAAPRPSHA